MDSFWKKTRLSNRMCHRFQVAFVCTSKSVVPSTPAPASKSPDPQVQRQKQTSRLLGPLTLFLLCQYIHIGIIRTRYTSSQSTPNDSTKKNYSPKLIQSSTRLRSIPMRNYLHRNWQSEIRPRHVILKELACNYLSPWRTHSTGASHKTRETAHGGQWELIPCPRRKLVNCTQNHVLLLSQTYFKLCNLEVDTESRDKLGRDALI